MAGSISCSSMTKAVITKGVRESLKGKQKETRIKRNQKDIHFVLLNDRPVAAHYGFVQNGWRYYFTPAYDPEFSHMSPGKVLLR